MKIALISSYPLLCDMQCLLTEVIRSAEKLFAYSDLFIPKAWVWVSRFSPSDALESKAVLSFSSSHFAHSREIVSRMYSPLPIYRRPYKDCTQRNFQGDEPLTPHICFQGRQSLSFPPPSSPPLSGLYRTIRDPVSQKAQHTSTDLQLLQAAGPLEPLSP